MPLEAIHRELIRIGKLLNYWQAELFASVWLAIFLALLWLGGFSDLFLKWGPAGRIVFWLLTVASLAAGIWHVWKALATRRTEEAIAVRIEQVFPQLDNRLINVVQFETVAASDPMRSAYLRQGVPNWNEVNPTQMRDSTKHKRAYIALGTAAFLLLAPFFWTSATWGNALARILNPFSSRAPITLSHILSVSPGNGTCVVGSPLTITLTAAGRSGQPVLVDFYPATDQPYSVQLGQLSGIGPQDFSYLLPKVDADLDYRIRAGDASARFHIAAVSPLSYSHIDITVTPPKSLGAPVQHLNGLTDQIVVPDGSQLGLVVTGNRPLTQSFVTMPGVPPIQLKSSDKGESYAGTAKVTQDAALLITSEVDTGESVTATMRVQLAPDLPPVIRIISPQGHGMLGAGAVPIIQFQASDDLGLSKLAIEQVDTAPEPNQSADQDTPGKVIQEWPGGNQRTFTSSWIGDGFRPKEGQTACFRVVAYDNFGGEQPHRTVSPTIVFQTIDPNDLSAAALRMAGETQATLDRLVALQTENLARTRAFTGHEPDVTPEQWTTALAVQKQIHEITGILISDPRKPLAALQQKVEPLYAQEMTQTVSLLQSITTAGPPSKPSLLAQVITKQDFILHILSGVDGAFARADRDRRISDVLALMDSLVHEQTQLNTDTAAAATAHATTVAPLTKKQDLLSGDADAFVATAHAESANMKGTDEQFSNLLADVARQFGTRNIPPDMLRASEQLDDKAPAQAEPIQAAVLNNLQQLQAMLNAWRADSAAARAAEMLAAFQKAADKMRRLADMQEKVLQSMKQWKAEDDATTGKESDAHEELMQKDAAMKEALFQIAADLQIFPEAQLGNEVVKDITTTYAKVDQDAGTEHQLAPERDLQKEDWMLKDVEKMADRIKDGIPTLPTTPTNANYTTEDFDKQEFPGPIAAVPLADKFEDLIGDLLKLDQNIEDETKSSATNQAFKDMYMEGPVAEGEWSNYSAKGKSGNTKPKDNEQSGRSNIGRQGMSDGETAAASGKINQGNDDIKRRMTQDAAQSGEMGKIDDSLAKTVATGGGKISGNADEFGMFGAGPRRDARDSTGGNGMAALLKKRADALYAAASLQHVRTGSLDEAIMHLRDADEAEQQGKPIEEVREYRRLAREALQKSQVELQGGISTQSIDSQDARKSDTQEVSGAADEAPAAYQQMVSDYYKSINNAPQP
jgi:hypothetical protein